MTLQPHPTGQGVWIDPAWQPDQPGTFAVVIGISAYDHLHGGVDPADDTYELGQLQVSALTAYRFFDWLRSAYSYESCTPTHCWLLLAPTQAELDVEPNLAVNAAPPTFPNCEDAISQWYAAMENLAPSVAERSRSFFFFSGHGLETFVDEQILLASDYLKGPNPNPNRNAINTRSLWKGMAPLGVRCQFLFADACRNDHQRLLDELIEGQDILRVRRTIRSRGRVAPILYASASGSQAWQPRQPAAGLEGISLFGRALLEGLQAQEGFEAICDDQSCAVNIYPLQTFAARRVSQLLALNESAEYQPVMLGGQATDIAVTHVPKPPLTLAPATPVPTIEETENNVFDIRHDVPGLRLSADFPHDWIGEYWQDDTFPSGHEVFGSETVTALWADVNVRSINGDDEVAAEHPYRIWRVERHQSRNAYRVEISFEGGGTRWLELIDRPPDGAGTLFACLLPGDRYSNPRYEVTLTREPLETYGHRLVRLDATLASVEQEDWSLSRAASLWETYRTSNIVESVSEMELGFLEETLRSKMQSPLAAAVAGALLLRAGEFDRLHDWMRNLADWFPDLPDGPVLWTEQVLQERGPDLFGDDDLERWLELRQRGLPTTSDAFGYAVAQAREFLLREDFHADQLQRVQDVADHLDAARRYFRSGGLFSTFAGPPGEVGSHLVAAWS